MALPSARSPRGEPCPTLAGPSSWGGGHPRAPRVCLGLRFRDECSPFWSSRAVGFQSTFLSYSFSFFSLPDPAVQNSGVPGRLDLCFFWLIEHFLSLFNMFQISGDCFPGLNGVWALANRNMPSAAAKGGVQRQRAEVSAKFSFSWADLFPSVMTRQDFPKPSPLGKEVLQSQSELPGANANILTLNSQAHCSNTAKTKGEAMPTGAGVQSSLKHQTERLEAHRVKVPVIHEGDSAQRWGAQCPT